MSKWIDGYPKEPGVYFVVHPYWPDEVSIAEVFDHEYMDSGYLAMMYMGDEESHPVGDIMKYQAIQFPSLDG